MRFCNQIVFVLLGLFLVSTSSIAGGWNPIPVGDVTGLEKLLVQDYPPSTFQNPDVDMAQIEESVRSQDPRNAYVELKNNPTLLKGLLDLKTIKEVLKKNPELPIDDSLLTHADEAFQFMARYVQANDDFSKASIKAFGSDYEEKILEIKRAEVMKAVDIAALDWDEYVYARIFDYLGRGERPYKKELLDIVEKIDQEESLNLHSQDAATRAAVGMPPFEKVQFGFIEKGLPQDMVQVIDSYLTDRSSRFKCAQINKDYRQVYRKEGLNNFVESLRLWRRILGATLDAKSLSGADLSKVQNEFWRLQKVGPIFEIFAQLEIASADRILDLDESLQLFVSFTKAIDHGVKYEKFGIHKVHESFKSAYDFWLKPNNKYLNLKIDPNLPNVRTMYLHFWRNARNFSQKMAVIRSLNFLSGWESGKLNSHSEERARSYIRGLARDFGIPYME